MDSLLIAAALVGLSALVLWLICGPKHTKRAPKSHGQACDRQAARPEITTAQLRQPDSDPGMDENDETRRKLKDCRECWTLGIEILGLLGLVTYAFITYGMWQEAQKQTVNSRTQANLQLRGYAYAEPTIIFEVGKPPLYSISVVNGGQTPITHISGSLHVHPAPVPEFGKPSAPPAGYAPDAEHTDAAGDFAFQKKTFDFNLPIKQGTVVDQAVYDRLFATRDIALYIWGRIDFSDIFKDKHWITYCYFYPPPPWTNALYGVCTKGNDLDANE
jgi:hypothetical protein